MNVVNLEVKITKIKIKTIQNCSICFSLRLGRILSSLSNTIINSSNNQLETNIDLRILCQQSLLKSNSRASLVIYETRSAQSRDIIGMIFILLSNKPGEVHRYLIQQSSDPNSYIELSFNITAIQVKEKQNQSMASKSSLAQIRQLHNVLTRNDKKFNSQLIFIGQESRNSRPSTPEKQYKLKIKNPNSKVTHLKTQQSPYNDQDPSYSVLLKRVQGQLTKQRQRNSILTNLLVIQQQKNSQSQNFIKKIITQLQKTRINKTKQIDKDQTSHILHHDYSKKPQDINTTDKNTKKSNNSASQLQTLVKQRDQLYLISQQLYDRVRLYKSQSQQFSRNVKSVQNQLKDCVEEIQSLRRKNFQLKQQIYQYQEKRQKQNNILMMKEKLNQLAEQNRRLIIENTEYERKFKQSYKAIEEFKNDAWKAQQQVITKQQEIKLLKQQLQFLRSSQSNRPNYKKQLISYQNISQISQSFQNLSQIMKNNNINRQQLLNKLKMLKQIKQINGINGQNTQISKILNELKQKIAQIYDQYHKENRKNIQILQMRKKVIALINSLNF